MEINYGSGVAYKNVFWLGKDVRGFCVLIFLLGLSYIAGSRTRRPQKSEQPESGPKAGSKGLMQSLKFYKLSNCSFEESYFYVCYLEDNSSLVNINQRRNAISSQLIYLRNPFLFFPPASKLPTSEEFT